MKAFLMKRLLKVHKMFGKSCCRAAAAADGEMLQLFRLYPKAVGKLLAENATA